METLEQGRQFLRDNWEKGVACPCCRQNVKLYPRPIHHTMAYLLIRLYRMCKERQDYYHIKDIYDHRAGNGSNDFAKFKMWGMIVEKPREKGQKGRTSGFWTVTQKGKDWIEGRISVPDRVMMFNKKSYGFSDHNITIRDALGVKFDYDELIADDKDEQQPSLF